MNVGFIGTGSMGSILIESFIKSGALDPLTITANNRSRNKVEQLAENYPGLTAARSNVEVVQRSDLVFLCIKPMEFKKVIGEIKAAVHAEQLIVSITSPVLIRHLEQHLPCKIAKVIPSITNYVSSGATLCIYGDRVLPADRDHLERLFTYISTPIRVLEQYTRVTSDLSSCGPAFLAFLVQKFIDAAVEETGIPRETAIRLASEMTRGTGELLTSGGFTPEELQKRVSVPGGITAEGIRMMSLELDGLFNRLIRTTHAKYEEDLDKIETDFYGQKMEEFD